MLPRPLIENGSAAERPRHSFLLIYCRRQIRPGRGVCLYFADEALQSAESFDFVPVSDFRAIQRAAETVPGIHNMGESASRQV
jgi:hypothetical protein